MILLGDCDGGLVSVLMLVICPVSDGTVRVEQVSPSFVLKLTVGELPDLSFTTRLLLYHRLLN